MTRLRRLVATVAATALATGAILALGAGAAGAAPLTKVAPADNLTDGKAIKIITQPMTYAPGSGPITATQCSADLVLAPGFGGPSPAPSANCHADNSIGALAVLSGGLAAPYVFADSAGKLTCGGVPCTLPGGVQQGSMNHEFTGSVGGPCTGGTICLGALQGYTGASHPAATCAPPLARVNFDPVTNPLGAIPPVDADMNGVIAPSESGQRGPDGCVVAVTNIGGGFGPGGLPVEYEANPIRFKATSGGGTAKLVLAGSGAGAPTDADADTDLDLSTITSGSLDIDTMPAVGVGEWSGFASNDAVNLQFLNKTDPQCRVSISTVITSDGTIDETITLPGYRNPLPSGETKPTVAVDEDGFDTIINVVLCNQVGHKVQIVGRGGPRPNGVTGVGSGGVSAVNKPVKMVSSALTLS